MGNVFRKIITGLLCLVVMSVFAGCKDEEKSASKEEDQIAYAEKALPDLIVAPLGAVNPADNVADVKAEVFGDNKVYFGNLHSHTKFSDGEGTPEEGLTWARDVVGYDFYALTDHAITMKISEWRKNKIAADKFNVDGEFVALRGWEYGHPISGHINIYGTDHYTTGITHPTIKTIYKWIIDHGAIAQFNHPGEQPKTYCNLLENEDFKIYYKRILDNMFGIETGNGGNGNNKGTYLDEYIKALDKGWKVAPTSNQDNHSLDLRSVHRTGLIAPALTRDDVLNAMSERRVYSTDDPNMKVAFKCGGDWMGSSITVNADSVKLTVLVEDDEPIKMIQIISNNGEIVAEQGFENIDAAFIFWSPKVDLTSDNTYFFAKIYETNLFDNDLSEQITVTAPIWVTRG